MKSTAIGQAAVIMGRFAATNYARLPEVAPKGFDSRSLPIAKALVAAEGTADGWVDADTSEGSATYQYFMALAAYGAFFAVLYRGLLQSVPFNKAIAAAVANLTGVVPGENRAALVARFVLDRRHLAPQTIIALLVADLELFDATGPDGSAFVDAMLQQAAAQAADAEFRLAMIDSNVTSIISAGATATNCQADIKSVASAVFGVGQSTSKGFWICSPDAAIKAATLTGTDGLPALPGMGIAGGILAGLPAFVSSAWPAATVTLFDGGQIVASADQIGIQASRAGAIEMANSSLVGDASQGKGTSLVSVFQSGAVAIKQTLRVGFERVRDSACAEIVDVAW